MGSEFENVIDYVELGQRIRAARRRLKMTQQALADGIGVSTSYIGHIERGLKRCSLDTAASLCIVLDMDANQLIFGHAGRERSQSEHDRSVISAYLQNLLSALDAQQ